jgi:hypothetical protein
MAPEQIEGLEADARTDIFAFGACCSRCSRAGRRSTGCGCAEIIVQGIFSNVTSLADDFGTAARWYGKVITCAVMAPLGGWVTR